MLRLARMSVAAFAASACAAPFPPAAAPASSTPRLARDTSAVAMRTDSGVAAFPFAGTWHVVGAGFPEGARDAVLAIGQRDSAYTLHFVEGGPPGRLLSMRVAGDSAHIRWEIDDGDRTEVMLVRMRGVRDSLVGTWETTHMSGALTGARRPQIGAMANPF